MKTHTIQVRQYEPGESQYTGRKFRVIETISRVLRAEQIGNFCPLFCRYANNPRVPVHSDEGDLSDPFRREESYANTLFITI